MDVQDEIFRTAIPDKLLAYGFVRTEQGYEYRAPLLDGEFELRVTVGPNGAAAETIDALTGEPYTLHLVAEAQGAFVGSVRRAYGAALEEIALNCCTRRAIPSETVQEVMDYIERRFGDRPEYLWERTPDSAVWRRKDNRKWYCALLQVPLRKFGEDGDGEAQILDLRTEALQEELRRAGRYPAYHMNKAHWLTVRLGIVPQEEVFELIEESYRLADQRKGVRKEKSCSTKE